MGSPLRVHVLTVNVLTDIRWTCNETEPECWLRCTGCGRGTLGACLLLLGAPRPISVDPGCCLAIRSR